MREREVNLVFCREEQAVSEPSSMRGGKGQGLMSLRGRRVSPRSWPRMVSKKEKDLTVEKSPSLNILSWFILSFSLRAPIFVPSSSRKASALPLGHL